MCGWSSATKQEAGIVFMGDAEIKSDGIQRLLERSAAIAAKCKRRSAVEVLCESMTASIALFWVSTLLAISVALWTWVIRWVQ